VRTVLYVGSDEQTLRRYFGHVRLLSTVNNGMEIRNHNQGKPIWLATDPVKSWDRLWPDFYRIRGWS